MTTDKTADLPQHDQARVTAAEWFAGGQRIPYDPQSGRVLTEHDVLTFPGGHLTTSEHPDLLAAAIRDIAARHGVVPRPTDNRRHETLNMEGSP